ncbi:MULTISPECIES: flagellar basal body L-ring protein FlgH [Selenomonas]|uniref:flagellar basal body L-ring protein FlgH n=1 Tax=Selenomonas TaxID=970 RepID=UPI0001EB223F|nr:MULTISPECIES: flagellar basal body L-ring protein FlgH [Selenomonas]EFR41887.1 flagellar L-ring protein FlgH [Selenomonas sp. oral taxon 137 str. F0430]EJP32987.1 flagellar L-ring protein FlgH [Selenomonas sp. FOBRC9]MBF1682152.1 flagellar basal body L-ring protein FlgH [Selenomonas artemidis]
MSKRKWLAGMLAAAFAVGSVAPAVSAESLWKNPSGYPTRNVFADHRAMNVGDIVTIIISETTTTSATRSSANEKSGSVSIGAGVGIFDFLKAASASGSDKFNAKGSASSTNRTIGNVTVTITEITPAGNFILEGTQSIWQNRNEHKITFRGMCRPEDISATNTVLSTRVADATVRFDGKGPLNAKQRQGILTQIFNILF